VEVGNSLWECGSPGRCIHKFGMAGCALHGLRNGWFGRSWVKRG